MSIVIPTCNFVFSWSNFCTIKMKRKRSSSRRKRKRRKVPTLCINFWPKVLIEELDSFLPNLIRGEVCCPEGCEQMCQCDWSVGNHAAGEPHLCAFCDCLRAEYEEPNYFECAECFQTGWKRDWVESETRKSWNEVLQEVGILISPSKTAIFQKQKIQLIQKLIDGFFN